MSLSKRASEKFKPGGLFSECYGTFNEYPERAASLNYAGWMCVVYYREFQCGQSASLN